MKPASMHLADDALCALIGSIRFNADRGVASEALAKAVELLVLIRDGVAVPQPEEPRP